MANTLENIIQKTRSRPAGAKLILATGVFDVLHDEHSNFLQKAKSAPLLKSSDTDSPPSPQLIKASQKAGHILVVGVESDTRVKQLKGPGRPINPDHLRAQKIAALPYVDYAFVLPKTFDKPQDHIRLIAALKPDILAISSHSSHQEAKQKIMADHGGRLQIVHTHNPEVSTTKLLEESS